MKKVFAFGLILAMSAMLFAGSQRTIWNYSDEGRYPSDVVIAAIDSAVATVGPKIVAAIDTVSAIAHRPLNIQLDWASTARDTIYHHLITIPAGMTATLRAAKIVAHVPPVGAVGNDSILMFMYFYDYSAGALVKYATTQRLSDSSQVTTLPGILVADSVETITIDSVTTFAANDVIYIATWADTALGGPENGCGVTIDLDYNE